MNAPENWHVFFVHHLKFPYCVSVRFWLVTVRTYTTLPSLNLSFIRTQTVLCVEKRLNTTSHYFNPDIYRKILHHLPVHNVCICINAGTLPTFSHLSVRVHKQIRCSCISLVCMRDDAALFCHTLLMLLILFKWVK